MTILCGGVAFLLDLHHSIIRVNWRGDRIIPNLIMLKKYFAILYDNSDVMKYSWGNINNEDVCTFI